MPIFHNNKPLLALVVTSLITINSAMAHAAPSLLERVKDVQYETNKEMIKKREYYPYFLKTDFNLTLEQANQKMRALKVTIIEHLKAAKDKPHQARIPKISHRVWVTNKNKPSQLPEIFIKNIIKSMENLPDFEHIIWTNAPQEIQPSIDLINAAAKGSKLVIRNVNDLPTSKSKEIAEAWLNQNVFAYASDIYRILIVELFGGIYSDCGWELSSDFNQLLTVDYIFNTLEADPGVASHNIIGAAPHSKILKEVKSKLDTVLERADFPNFINELSVIGIREIVCPSMITSAAAALLDATEKLYLFDLLKGQFVKIAQLGSHRNGNFGSTTQYNLDAYKFYTAIGVKEELLNLNMPSLRKRIKNSMKRIKSWFNP